MTTRWLIFAILVAGTGMVPGVNAQVRPGIRAARQIAEAQRRADAQIERLLRMTPVQRERVLSAMAPDRRQRIEARLAELGHMNDNQRAKLGRQLQSFRDLPVADQQRLRGLAKQLNMMDLPRRRVVRRELLGLRAMADADRQTRLASDEFRRQFSTEERDLLEQLGALRLDNE